MRKYLTISLLLNCFFHAMTFAHEEPAKTLREKQDKEKERRRIASQKIHTVIATKTVFDTTGTTTASFRYLETEYLENGCLSSITLFEPNGATQLMVRYEYDRNHNMTVDADYDSIGRLIEKAVYCYDDSGRVTGSTNYKKDSIDSRFVYVSQYAQSSVCFYKYAPNDSLEYRIDYYYSKPLCQGLLMDAYKYIPGGDTSVHAEYVYNAMNQLIRKNVYGLKGKLTHLFDYDYDDAGNRKRITKILSGGNIEWTQEFTHDSTANTKSLTVFDSKRRKITELKYDYNCFE